MGKQEGSESLARQSAVNAGYHGIDKSLGGCPADAAGREIKNGLFTVVPTARE